MLCSTRAVLGTMASVALALMPGILPGVAPASASSVVLGSPAKAPPRGKESYTVVDAMPAFWDFWAQAKDLDEPAQVRLFQQLVVGRYPEVYNREVMGGPKNETFAEALPGRYHLMQGYVLPKMAIVKRLSRQIGKSLPRYEKRFRRTFPDLTYTGRIYFLYSLGAFDGGTRTVAGQPALLFGLDLMAYVYGDELDPEPFFEHELFHVYHGPFFGHHEELVAALWREGLATYAAHALNPKAAGVALFGLPRTTPARVRAALPRYVRELRRVLDSEAPETYARYFLGGLNEQASTPERSGYYLGYLVAEKLSRRHSLRELAHAPLSQLRPEIEQALQELETTATGS